MDQDSVVSGKVFDLAQVMSRLDNDVKFLHELMQIFANDHKKYLTSISEAISERNFEKIKVSSHALKSALGNVGAMKSMELALTLEKIAASGDLPKIESVASDLRFAINEFLQAYQDWKQQQA